MLEKLAELIKEQLNYDGEVKAESNFKDDLGADSLDLFELVMSMEEEFGVEIPSEDLEKIATVGDVIDYLKAKGVDEKNMKTRITELLGIEEPVIQGGMAWVAEYHLAAAVS